MIVLIWQCNAMQCCVCTDEYAQGRVVEESRYFDLPPKDTAKDVKCCRLPITI